MHDHHEDPRAKIEAEIAQLHALNARRRAETDKLSSDTQGNLDQLDREAVEDAEAQPRNA